MSREIDEKVVSMQFDNQKFEKNVSVTMNTLDKLKAKLNFNGASKGLENVNAAAKKCDVSGINKGIETVKAKFSALEVIGVTALANITNSAVNAGKRITKALTIDPIKTGFEEYETQINAVQTILANTQSKGSTLKDVNAALDELNTYADKTIYNFTEMTRNIGTFTAAGVDLDKSVTSIKGIANLAAVSGSTSQQASTAMYQLSQALAAGKVQLMDWNSVVNAGMGGQIFQDALKRTATQMGYNVDAMIKKYGSFRESLTKGEWLTAEVLTETLTQLSGAYSKADLISQGYTESQAKEIMQLADTAVNAATKVKTFTQLFDTLKEAAQSGWTQTWELIVGDFEEAKEFLTYLSDKIGDVINKSSNSRNDLLKGALGSKWDTLAEKINKAGISTEDFQSKLKETAKENGISIDSLVKKYGSLEKVIKAGKIPVDIFVKTLKKFVGASSETAKSTDKVTKKVENLEKVVKKVINGDFGNGEARVKALTKAGYDYATVQDLVNKVLKGEKVNFDKLSDSQLKNMGYTKDQIKAIRELAEEAEKTGTPINELIDDLGKPTGRELLVDSFKNALNGLLKVMNTVGKAWRDIFPAMTSNQLYNIIEGLNTFSKHLVMTDETADKLRRTLRGLFAILDIITTITGGAFKIALKLLCKVLKMADVDILGVTASAGDAIVAFRDWLFTNNILVKGFKKLLSGGKEVLSFIKKMFGAFVNIPTIRKSIDVFGNAMSNVTKRASNYFGEGIDRINEFIKRVKSMDSITLDDLDDIFKDFKENVIDYFFDFPELFKRIKTAFEDFKDGTSKATSVAGDKLDWLKDKIIGFAESVKDRFYLGDFIAFIIGGGLLLAIKKISDAFDKLSSLIDGFTPGKIVDKFISALTPLIKAKAFEAKTSGIKNLAIAIGILAGSLALLTAIDQNKLWSATGALTLLTGVLIGLTVAISKVEKFGNFAKASASMISLAGTLIILANCLKIMDGLNPTKAVINAILLEAMAAGLATVAGILGAKVPQLSKGSLTLIALAVSLRIMSSALVDLGSVNITNAFKSIALMTGMIIGLTYIAKACRGVNKGAALNILAIVISLKILVGAFNSIANMNIDKVGKNIGAFIVIFGTFALLMKASAYAGKNAGIAGLGIIAMSIALLIIVKAFDKIAKMDASGLSRATVVMTILLGVFAGIVKVSQYAGKYAIRAGAMLILMAGALLILTVVITILKNMKPEGLGRALGTIVLLEAVFAGLIAVTHFAKDVKGTLITLTVALVLLSSMLIALSFIDPTKLAAATGALTSVIGIFSLLVYITRYLKTGEKAWKRNAATLLAITGVIVILAGVIALLSKCRVGSTIEVVASLSLLLGGISGVMLAIGNSKTITAARMTNAIKALYAMTGVITILATIIGLLSVCKPGSTVEIASSLSVLLISLAGSLALMSFVGPLASGAIGAAYAMSGVVAILAGILLGLTKLDIGSTLEIVASLSILLLTLSGACVILGLAAPATGPALLAAGAMTLVVAALGGILLALTKFNVGPTLEIVASLSTLLISLSGACVILGIVGTFGHAALIGVGVLSALISAVAVLVTIIGALATGFPALEEFLNTGIPILGKIGYALGSFVGNILGGLSAGITAGLPEMGTNLSKFMTNLTPFINGAKNIDEKVLSSVKALAQTILILTAADIIDSLTSFFTGGSSIENFGSQLAGLGTSMSKFATNLGTFDESKVTSVTCAANALKNLATAASSIPNEGGWAAKILGDNSIAAFGDKLPALATNLKNFMTNLGTIDDSKVTSATGAANVIKALAKAADEIPNEGGWAAKILGDNSIASFGSKLPALGTNLKNFITNLGTFDEDKVTTATCAGNAIKALASAANEIPNEGGWAAKILGDNSLATFGSKLPALGTNLKGFITNLGTFGEDKIATVDCACTAIKALASAADKIPNEGGLWAQLVGDNSLATFGDKLPDLGKDIADFAEKAGDVDVSKATNAANVLKAIVDLTKLDVSSKGSDMKDFSKNLKSLASGISKTIESLSDVSVDSISAAISKVKELISLNTTVASVDSSAMKTFGNSLKTLGDNGVKKFVEAFGSGSTKEKVTKAATNMLNSFVKGAKSKQSDVKKRFTDIVSKAISAIKTESNYSKFKSAGSYLVSGFAAGISENSYKASAKAAAMAKAAEEAARNELDINSPSKVFRKIGYSVPEGFAMGIDRMAHLVKKSSISMADTAKNGLSNAIGKISNIVNSDIDAQPTIRPVLDLSDITSGVSAIDGLFGMQPSVGVLSNVGAISSMMNRGQNGANDDVVSAINGLKKSISEMSGNTYNIDGVTYDDGSNISNAVKTLVRASKIERRI